MRFDILSLFPDYFKGPFDVSIIKRALQKELISIGLVDIRTFAEGRHRKVDDRPYGGGPGMVLMAEPLTRAIRSVKRSDSYVVYLSPQGRKLDAALSMELAKRPHLVLVCGHYEGIDERVIEGEIDLELSIGDYVLTSGCAAAVVVVEAASRFIPGVLGDDLSSQMDSFQEGIFDAPHYTRPEVFEKRGVPEVLKSGNHEQIARWRKEKALIKTGRVRPDIIGRGENDEKMQRDYSH